MTVLSRFPLRQRWAGNQGCGIEQKQKIAVRLDGASRHTAPATLQCAPKGPGLATCFDHVLHSVDEEGVGVAVGDDDHRIAALAFMPADFERSPAIHYRKHP